MKILITSAKYKLNIKEYCDKLKDTFIIDKVKGEEIIFDDEEDRYYDKYYIDIYTLEDILKIKEILKKDLIIRDYYHTPMFDYIEENCILVYDDYLEQRGN